MYYHSAPGIPGDVRKRRLASIVPTFVAVQTGRRAPHGPASRAPPPLHAPIPRATVIARSSRTRSSVDGWVAKRRARLAPRKGLTMERCAVAGCRSHRAGRLFFRQQGEQSARYGYRCMLQVAAGGEGAGLCAVDEVERGHRADLRVARGSPRDHRATAPSRCGAIIERAARSAACCRRPSPNRGPP